MKPYWIRVKDSGCFQMKIMADTCINRGNTVDFMVGAQSMFTVKEEDVIYIIYPVKVEGEWVKPDNITYIQPEEIPS